MHLKKTTTLATLLLTISLWSFGQDKQLSKPRNGIEVNLRTGQLLEDIPIDQDITLYGALPDSTVLSGRFEVWKKNGKEDSIRVWTGDLKILDKKTFQGYVDYFFRAYKTYKIYFLYKKELPQTFQVFIQRRLIEYYREVFHIAGASKDAFQTTSIIGARQKLEQDILAKSAEFDLRDKNLSKMGGLLDSSAIKLANNLVNLGAINVFSRYDQKMHKIDSVSKKISWLLKEFTTTGNMDKLSKIFPPVVVDNFKQIKASDKFALLVGTGRLRLSDVRNLPPVDIVEVSKSQLENLTENIAQNIALMQKFEDSNAFTVPEDFFGKISSEMNQVSEYYKSIIDDVATLKVTTHELVSNNIVEEIEEIYSTNVKITRDFETTARWYVSADLGVAWLNLAKNTNVNLNATNDSWKLLSYLGINVSPVPVNKKNSIRELRRHNYNWAMTLLKVSSIGVGVTMSTLDKEKYKGIFNIDSPRGFLTGFGVRPIPQIKLSVGWIWYDRKNGNVLTDSYNIACRPYLSASLDWDLRNLLPSIKSLFN